MGVTELHIAPLLQQVIVLVELQGDELWKILD
jgi:hypothetical protein